MFSGDQWGLTIAVLIIFFLHQRYTIFGEQNRGFKRQKIANCLLKWAKVEPIGGT